ncbi:hypothetical protein AAG906_032627 [Vitis piasezkii]
MLSSFKELLTSIEGQDWTENVKEKGLLFYKWKQEHGNSTTKGLISHLASVVGASLSIKSDVLQEEAPDDFVRDMVGHGTHTASTAAANQVNTASFSGLAQGAARGGVPSAMVAFSKVCHASECEDADILAAFDYAIVDGLTSFQFH